MTENDAFNLPMDMDDSNTIFIDRMLSQMTSVSSAQPTSLSLNQNQIMAEFPALSMFQGDPMNNLHASPTISNHFGIVDCNTSMPTAERLGKNTNITNPSLNSSRLFSNFQLQEQCMGRSVNPLEILDTSISNHYLETLNSAFATSVSCGYDGVLGGLNHKYLDKFLACPEAAVEVPGTTGFQPFQLMGNDNVIHSGWTSSDNANMSPENLSGSFKFSNELSLSLSTCQHSIICGTSIPGQCSEISCSGVTHHPLNERQFGSETSCNSKNLFPSIGPHMPVQLSQFSSGSKYLSVIQEILAEIASYSFSSDRGYAPMGHDGAGRCEVQTGVVLQGREVEAKKKQLLALLQVVDERYNQCLDETHTVVSAFHAATELDPHVHARFALQTVSSLYKNLRERISNQILAMGGYFNGGETRGEDQETSFETSFIKKQWALQQLRRKDHQLWRPQRGLPERSVSVLRAWMFQNFLHPYPKDAEKHLLAVKSGLTRSQVSNWFINARVRLWKPMIDEMFAEMNRRKGLSNDEEKAKSSRRSHLMSIDCSKTC